MGRGLVQRSPSSGNGLGLLQQQHQHQQQQVQQRPHSYSSPIQTSSGNLSLDSNEGATTAALLVDHDEVKDHRRMLTKVLQGACSIRLLVLLVLCLQNSLFTVLRRYSQGVLKEDYSKYECLLVGEIVKMVFSAYMIQQGDEMDNGNSNNNSNGNNIVVSKSTSPRPLGMMHAHLGTLIKSSGKMFFLALIYGAMNILSFVALRNIGAGIFTVVAQCKILTTAVFSKILLQRQYSSTKWRALIALVFGVLLFSEPIWSNKANLTSQYEHASPTLGLAAVLTEVTLSGFASIYFEKVIKAAEAKTDAKLSIWERNFQLAFGSVPVYLAFIVWDQGGEAGYGGGWSFLAVVVSMLGAAGGLLVALSIKYGDAILKTLATTGAILLSSVLDHAFLGGPLTPLMMIAGVQVVIAICNYTFDATAASAAAPSTPKAYTPQSSTLEVTEKSIPPHLSPVTTKSRVKAWDDDEEKPLVTV